MSEDKNKKLKNWIKVAMSLYVLAFVVGIGLNINNTVSKAEQLENTTVSPKKLIETTNTLENISKENVETTTETTKQEEKQGKDKDSSLGVIGTVENTTDSKKQEEKQGKDSNVSVAKQTEVTEVKQATNTYTEEQTKQEDNSSEISEILEDVLETKYNASNFEEDHSKECALDAEMYNDNYCEGFYKLIDKTASEKALRAYMLDYHVFDYFGVDSATNTLNINTAYLADGSIATSTDTAIYREFNGKKTKLLDVNNNPNHYYFENGFYINNRGIIFRTTISKATKTLIIPDKISGITVKGIDGAVFRDYNFTSVSLPDTVEIIGHEEFYNSTFTTFKRPKNLKYTAHNMFNPNLSVTIIN